MASLYTLTDLQDAIYARLEDNTIFFTSAYITYIINEALRCVNLMTGFYQGTQTVISVANQVVYKVPVGMLYPQRVQFESSQLDPIPITRIGQDYRTWTTDNTNNNGPVAHWIPIGNTLFCIHPVDSLGGQSIFVTGVMETPVLVNPTDTMSLEDQYVSAIVEYGAMTAPLCVGGANFVEASKLYQTSFVPQMKKLGVVQRFKFPRYFILNGSPTTEGKIQ